MPFRCQLSSAIAALQELEQGSDAQEVLNKKARAMRNEAAIAGGIWSQESAAEQRERAKTPRITKTEYPPNKDWDLYSGPVGWEDPLPYTPVFCTTDISLEVGSSNSLLFSRVGFLKLISNRPSTPLPNKPTTD